MQIEYVQSCSVTILAYVRNGYFFFLWVLDNPRGQYKQNIICIYIDYLKKDSGSLIFLNFTRPKLPDLTSLDTWFVWLTQWCTVGVRLHQVDTWADGTLESELNAAAAGHVHP